MTQPDLKRMRQRRDETASRILMIRNAAQREAESIVRSSKALPYTHGRHSTSWTSAHENSYRHWTTTKLGERHNELAALERKLARQNNAITAYHLKSARLARKA
ncbi:hypothetical protein GCM10010990_34630 [Croceicoccus mobilis]|uniref:Uncharacterized protein n=2 Tax=Croceicoccus mobilis TaxID=1703339 RepID=A0A917DZJ4_9SPHN|nr:hypothetical protein GCM10010990_34630 [Croceicoccus mobilis]